MCKALWLKGGRGSSWGGMFHFLSACTVRQGWGPSCEPREGRAGAPLCPRQCCAPFPGGSTQVGAPGSPTGLSGGVWGVWAHRTTPRRKGSSPSPSTDFSGRIFPNAEARALLSSARWLSPMGCPGVSTQPHSSALGWGSRAAKPGMMPACSPIPGTGQVGVDFSEGALRAVSGCAHYGCQRQQANHSDCR